MAKILYNSNPISPIEAVSISYEPSYNDAGDKQGSTYSISIRGKLLSNRGSPTSSGTFLANATNCQIIANTGIGENNWTESLLAKRCALNNLFKTPYQQLLIGTVAGGNDLTCYPRVTNFTVEESDNPQYWPYTVGFTADNLFCNGSPVESTGTYQLRTSAESWEFTYDDNNPISESGDNRLYTVTHNVSAQGMKTFGPSGTIAYSGIDAARNYVKSKIGLLATQPITAISGFANYTTKYNYVDVHSIDLASATYGVAESWVYSTGNYIEEYSIESTTSTSRTCPTVSINGTITGLGVRNLGTGAISTSKYANAVAYWDSIKGSGLKSRAESRAGVTLYSTPASTSVTMAPLAGTISYNYEYQGGPTKELTSALWENVTVNSTFNEDMYAAVGILGRGEIIQKVNGGGYYKIYKTTLNIDAIYPCSTGIHKLGPRYTAGMSDEIQSLVNSYNPLLTLSGVGYQAVDSQSETWSPRDSSYNYNVTWSYQFLGVCG